MQRYLRSIQRRQHLQRYHLSFVSDQHDEVMNKVIWKSSSKMINQRHWKRPLASDKWKKKPTSASRQHREELFLQRKTQVADGKCAARHHAAGALLHGRFRFQTLDFVHGRLPLLTCEQSPFVTPIASSLVSSMFDWLDETYWQRVEVARPQPARLTRKTRLWHGTNWGPDSPVQLHSAGCWSVKVNSALKSGFLA